MQRLGLAEYVLKAWLNMIKGRALYQKCDAQTCLGTLVVCAPPPDLTSQCMSAKLHGRNSLDGRQRDGL